MPERASRKDVRDAVRAARGAQPKWGGATAYNRGQVVYRIARTIREAAEQLGGYFASKTEADSFEAELSYLLVNQYGAFNSPVWFNCGLYQEYGIEGSGGNHFWNPATETISTTTSRTSMPDARRDSRGA